MIAWLRGVLKRSVLRERSCYKKDKKVTANVQVVGDNGNYREIWQSAG